jgi:hypothetical protein
MMSLVETNTLTVVKKQYFYKLKGYLGFFVSLISAQVIAMLMSLNGVMSSGMGDSNIHLNVRVFSGELIIGFTMFWGIATAFTLTTKQYRNFDFVFVTNRLTSGLSTIAFIITISIIGSLSAILTGILMRVILFFTTHTALMSWEYFMIPPPELLLSVYVTSLYLILVSAIGYFFGILFQLFKLLALSISIIIVALAQATGGGMFRFFLHEESLFLLTIKVLLTFTLLFGGSILLTNRMEVRS